MMVVQELDKTLFESYVKPKSTDVMSIVRGGILDPEMDWYETPQPKGNIFQSLFFKLLRTHPSKLQRSDPMCMRQ